MPRGDRSGPMGMGPGTGRQMGFCAGFDSPGYMNVGMGRGIRGRGGFAGGGGRGYRNRFYATGIPGWMAQPAYAPDPQAETQMLESHARQLEKQLEDVKEQIKKLNEKNEED